MSKTRQGFVVDLLHRSRRQFQARLNECWSKLSHHRLSEGVHLCLLPAENSHYFEGQQAVIYRMRKCRDEMATEALKLYIPLRSIRFRRMNCVRLLAIWLGYHGFHLWMRSSGWELELAFYRHSRSLRGWGKVIRRSTDQVPFQIRDFLGPDLCVLRR